MKILRYQKEASKWVEGLPVGNGLTGVVSYGSLKKERLAVNNSSLWSGYPKNQNNKESLENLQKVRDLLDKGKYAKACKLTQEKLNGGYSESYLPLGDIIINIESGSILDYSRELDVSKAIIQANSKDLNSTLFANYPSNVCCYRLEGNFSVEILLNSKLKSKTYFDETFNLVGNAPDHVVPNYVIKETKPVKYTDNLGMAFCLAIKVETDGTLEYSNDFVRVKNATYMNMFFTTETGFTKFNEMPIVSTESIVKTAKERLQSLDYEKILKEHIEDYQKIYNKNELSFNTEKSADIINLLDKVELNNIPKELVEIFYNYGKYLLISGSRKGGQALNLQGIWNEDLRPAWSSNYTVNINTEMNYWPVSKCNLMDCIYPFLDLVYELNISGKDTAKINYGVNGACCNHNTDIWRKTSPVIGNPNFMFEPLCGVWLVNELYSHYKNSKDTEFTDKMKEILIGAATFVNEYLVLKDGYYVISPSTSPEAEFSDKLVHCGVSIATAFDMGLVKQLFNNYLEMDSTSRLALEIKEKIPKLYPFKDGKLGIQEFYADKKIVDKGHRHFSPLYCFYPGNLINYYGNKDDVNMIRKLFISRVSHSKNHIGWSAGWGICIAAKLHDKANIENIMCSLFKKSVFTNLFDAHFPNIFQIDGNFGFVAGMNEMLVYVENDVVELLPALINNLESGSMRGYVYNGIELNFKWKDGKVTEVESSNEIKLLNVRLADDVKLSENIKIVEGVY